MTKGISCDTYFDRVEIKMVGEATITIERPKHIPLQEWESFWGVNRPSTPRNGTPFTKEDVDANNTRRLANLNR